MAEKKNSETTYNVDTKDCKYVLIGNNNTVKVYPPKGTNSSKQGRKKIKFSKRIKRFARKKSPDTNDNETQQSQRDPVSGTNADSSSWLRVAPTIDEATNAGHTGSLPPYFRTRTTSDEMCYRCIKKNKTRLPQDRNKWPISQIENSCLQAIYQLLDIHYMNENPLLSALGFSENEATSITQKFIATKGYGTAKKALNIWGTPHRENNNVGALKEIVKCTMKRNDVFCLITNWEKAPVCHGCGTPPQREFNKDHIDRKTDKSTKLRYSLKGYK